MQYAVNIKSSYLRGLDPIYIYRQELRILTDDVFERNQDLVEMQDRLRFNTFLRLFFARIVVWTNRPGMGWRKGKKKGDLPECNSHISKYALQEKFAAFIEQLHLELPDTLKNVETHYENLSSLNGSPQNYIRTDLSWQFSDSLRVFLGLEDYNHTASANSTTPNKEDGYFFASL